MCGLPQRESPLFFIFPDFDFSIVDPNLDLWIDDEGGDVWIQNGPPFMIGATPFPTEVIELTEQDGTNITGTIMGQTIHYENSAGTFITGTVAADGLSVAWTDGEDNWTWTRSTSCAVTCGSGAECKNGACQCFTGYEGDPLTVCDEIDECDANNPRHLCDQVDYPWICRNTDGAHSCGTYHLFYSAVNERCFVLG